MSLLVITPDDDGYGNSPTFLVYDTETKELVHRCEKVPELDCADVIGRPTFRPFGITNSEKYLCVVSHKNLGVFDKNTYQFIGLLDVPLFVNTHEIAACDGILYIANTSNNTIGIYGVGKRYSMFFNVNTFEISTEALTPINVESHDTAHVNSLCIADNRVYFSLHNSGRRASQLGYFDTNTFKAEIVAEAGLCTHGVRVLNNKLYSLSTGTGEIVEVNLDTKEVALHKVVNPAKTFLRGLDVLNGAITFGGSNLYADDRTIYMNNCFVAQFDAETKKSKVLMNIDDAYIITDMKVLT